MSKEQPFENSSRAPPDREEAAFDYAWALIAGAKITPGELFESVAPEPTLDSRGGLPHLRHDLPPLKDIQAYDYHFARYREYFFSADAQAGETVARTPMQRLLYPPQHLKEDPEFQMLVKVIGHAKRIWNKMARENVFVQPDTIEALLDKHTKSSAVTIVVCDPDPEKQTLDYPFLVVRFYTDKKDFPDYSSLPDEFQALPELSRGDRQFSNFASKQYERAAMDLAYERMFELRKGPILTWLLTRPEDQAKAYIPALIATRSRGFVPTGHTKDVETTLRDGSSVIVGLDLHIFPPRNATELELAKSYQASVIEQEISAQTKVVPFLPFLTTAKKEIALITPKALPETALLCDYAPNSNIIEVSNKADQEKSSGRSGRKALRRIKSDHELSVFEDQSFDTILNSNTLREVLGESSSKAETLQRSKALIESQLKRLKPDGSIVFDELLPIPSQADNGLSRRDIHKILKGKGLRVVQSEESTDNCPEGHIKITIAAKIRSSVEMREISALFAGPEEQPFVHISSYLNTRTGAVVSIPERRNQTLGLVPWYPEQGQIILFGKDEFPRPIIRRWVTEEISGIKDLAGKLGGTKRIGLAQSHELQNVVEADLREILDKRAMLTTEKFNPGALLRYYPSSSSIDEIVVSFPVEIDPADRAEFEVENYSGLSSSGKRRGFESREIFKRAATNGLPCNRLELMARRLHLDRGLPFGHWNGEKVELQTQDWPNIALASPTEQFSRKSAPVFRHTAAASLEDSFFEKRFAEFGEIGSDGTLLPQTTRREYVTPNKSKGFSNRVTPLILSVKTEAGLIVALENVESPVAQKYTGNASITQIPTYRIPLKCQTEDQVKAFLAQALKDHFRLECKGFTRLGGKYFTSPGVSDEVVQPYVVEIDATSISSELLNWSKLDKNLLLETFGASCAHTMTGLGRIFHALGLDSYQWS